MAKSIGEPPPPGASLGGGPVQAPYSFTPNGRYHTLGLVPSSGIS